MLKYNFRWQKLENVTLVGMFMEGKTLPTIAHVLQRSRESVRFHKGIIMEKMLQEMDSPNILGQFVQEYYTRQVLLHTVRQMNKFGVFQLRGYHSDYITLIIDNTVYHLLNSKEAIKKVTELRDKLGIIVYQDMYCEEWDTSLMRIGKVI